MGNILSSEEKIFRQHKNDFGKTAHGLAWIDDQFGYHHIGGKSSHKYRNKRNLSFYTKNGKIDVLRSKSHSLDAIIEELYFSGGEDNNISKSERGFSFEGTKTFIPRIKLTRSVSSLKDEKRYKQLYKMSTNPDVMYAGDLANSSQTISIKKQEEGVDYNIPSEESNIYLDNNNEYDEIPKKVDENYFAKNFDECMKRLQLIEKEHEMIEKDDGDLQFYYLQQQNQERRQMNASEENRNSSSLMFNSETKNNGNEERDKSECDKQSKIINVENSREFKSSPKGSVTVEETEIEKGDSNSVLNQEPINEWYSNLKHQFEKSNEEENEETERKEMSCRITGATLKISSETQKPENKEKDTRHYFSRLVKSKSSLIDEELPDPDKVKNIRAMFQENLNSTLKRKLDKKMGGSLQNISAKSMEQHIARPLSAQCNRDDIIENMCENQKVCDSNESQTGETSESKDAEKDFHIGHTKRKLFEKYDKDLKLGRDFRSRKLLQPKWTDTGSVSSGVSSDLSSYDTDVESYLREGPEQEPDDMAISDDDLLEEVKDKHYVQNEILEKIRSFGTSVTYYGGEMVTCSIGSLLSPTAQAIMEEITEKYGDKVSTTRSFDEFYRKYVETNEPNRKKKVGRTRSFGQNDVFQKPNVLNNTEIEMYKNDLEIEIGIKKPTGIAQNGLKPKLTKSKSLESQAETLDKSEKKFSGTPTITIDAASEDSDDLEKRNSISKDDIIHEENEPLKSNEFTEMPEEINFCDTKPSENHKETTIHNQVQYETKEKAEEMQKPIERKQPLLDRSISAPEAYTGERPEFDVQSDRIEFPSKEILFGYEKSLLNGKRKSDMEFEEFEVCETVAEKLEKLKEMNSSGSQNEKETNGANTNFNQVEENQRVCEGKFEESRENETSEPTFRSKKKSSEYTENNSEVDYSINQMESKIYKESPMSEETKEETKSFHSDTSIIGSYQNDKKFGKHCPSRWPIETSVMVDIQKTNEQTPKLVTNGKTLAKTKVRLF